MNAILKATSIIIILFLVGCKKEKVEKPKVSYEKTSHAATSNKPDISTIQVADLPIQMQGTNYLIFPVGDLNILDNNSRTNYDVSSSTAPTSFKISNYGEHEITGFIRNLAFQEIGSDSIKSLTDKPVLIQTVTYLKTVAEKAKQSILVYTLSDADTNKDGKLDASDIKSLYLSEISGNRFVKISPDFQELIDWNVIESKNRLYFRTMEDTNKSGAFDKNDVIHYHYIDLSNKEWKVYDINIIR